MSKMMTILPLSLFILSTSSPKSLSIYRELTWKGGKGFSLLLEDEQNRSIIYVSTISCNLAAFRPPPPPGRRPEPAGTAGASNFKSNTERRGTATGDSDV